MHFSRWTCLVFVELSLLASLALGQFDNAAVLGAVRDDAGNSVPDAVVTLHNLLTGFTQETRTALSGDYLFPAVPVGQYQVTTSKPGFLEGQSEAFSLNVSARQRVDFEMISATVQTSVSVVATPSLVESDSSDRGQVVNTRQIIELPLNGRAYSELVYLTPGSIPSPSAGSKFNDREGSFNANGLRSVFNNFLLDGLDNNYYGTSNQGFSNQVAQLPPDAVAEFKVITNNMSAEYGRSGGATVNVAMRTGSNDFHGTAWEFFRNTRLNAVGFFKPTSGEKPRLNRNQFGFTFGGPVLIPGAYNGKNKTFFFADYEGFREVESEVKFATIPNEQQRNGVLGVPVANVNTGTVYPAGVIPITDMIPFAREVLASLPPTTSTAAANNYQRLVRVQNYRDKGDVKLDHNFTHSSRVFFRYSQSRADIFDPGVIPGIAGGDGNGTVRIPVIQFATGGAWILSPSSILEARFGLSRARSGKKPVLSGGPSMYDMFGIPGLPTDPEFTGGITYQGLVGFTPLGRQFTNPQFQHPYVYTPKVNYTHTLGRHTLKAGAEVQWVNVEQQDIHPTMGLDAYQGLFSGRALASAGLFNPQFTALYSLADFMFGSRAAYVLSSPAIANIRQRNFFAYLQDDIKLTDRLTLNLGVRYEYGSPIFERDNHLSNWNPDTREIDLASDGGISDRALVDPDRDNFAPRVGLAYRLLGDTVIRTGYGQSFIHWNRVGTSYLTLNAPYAILSQQVSIPGMPGYRNTQQGYPDGFVSPDGFDKTISIVQHMPQDSPTADVKSWFFSIQQGLGRDWLLDVAYVGNVSNNLVLINDINQAGTAPPEGLIPVQYRRPIPEYGTIPALMPWGFSNYHGLQAKIEKRFGNGLYFLNSFTYSKTIDNGGQPLDGGAGGNDVPSVQNIHDLNADRGLSPYDRTFVNATSVVWEIPLGTGRRFGSSLRGVADAILGGWQITAINNMRSGVPVTLTYQPSLEAEVSPLITVFGRNMYRPNVLGNPLVPDANRTHDNYLDRSIVSTPPQHAPFGNAGRNIVRGPAFYQIDLGLYKNFAITERINLQFRAESFNAFNRTNFKTPDAEITSQSFGKINSTFDPREFQLALKLMF